MTRITLELDDKVVDRLRAEAALTGDELDVYLRQRIESLPVTDPFWGFMVDSDFVDELLEDIMSTRETQVLRTPSPSEQNIDVI